MKQVNQSRESGTGGRTGNRRGWGWEGCPCLANWERNCMGKWKRSFILVMDLFVSVDEVMEAKEPFFFLRWKCVMSCAGFRFCWVMIT